MTTLVVALIVGGYGIKESGLLNIREVEVVGAEVLNPRVLAELSGLEGQYLLGADFASAERRLEGLPLVAAVKVERSWPLGVRIRVSERQGLALWERAGVRYVIDQDGRVLHGVDAPPRAPVIIDTRSGELAPAGRLAPAGIVEAASRLASQMPVVVGRTPETFRYEEPRGLVVTTADGLTAVFGDSRDLDYKLAVWKAVLGAQERGQLPRAATELVDLRYGDRPSFPNAVARPASTPTVLPERPRPSPVPAQRNERPASVRVEPTPASPPVIEGLAVGDAARRNGTREPTTSRSGGRDEGGTR